MRLLAISTIVAVLAVFVGLWISEDPGAVVIQIRGLDFQGSFVSFMIVMIVLFALFYVAVRFAGMLLRSPELIRLSNLRRKARAAHAALVRGFTELSQGHWHKAEKALTKSTMLPETAALGYLGAARAAQQQGQLSRRDRYLALAANGSNDDITVGITKAQLLIENQEFDEAICILRQLRRHAPNNKLVLNMLKECFLETHAWEELASLMPALLRHKVITRQDALLMDRNAYAHILTKAANTGDDSRALDAAWAEVPAAVRHDPEVLTVYIRFLLEHGERRRPESLLRNELNHHWEEKLVHLYGLIDSDRPADQLAQAEKWLRRHPDDATLLLTLGRLAIRNHLWAKARNYLEQSAELDPRPETYLLLGKLLEQTGDQLIAGDCFRKGLGIMVHKVSPLKSLPDPTLDRSLPAVATSSTTSSTPSFDTTAPVPAGTTNDPGSNGADKPAGHHTAAAPPENLAFKVNLNVDGDAKPVGPGSAAATA